MVFFIKVPAGYPLSQADCNILPQCACLGRGLKIVSFEIEFIIDEMRRQTLIRFCCTARPHVRGSSEKVSWF